MCGKPIGVDLPSVRSDTDPGGILHFDAAVADDPRSIMLARLVEIQAQENHTLKGGTRSPEAARPPAATACFMGIEPYDDEGTPMERARGFLAGRPLYNPEMIAMWTHGADVSGCPTIRYMQENLRPAAEGRGNFLMVRR
jgi:hypothetical protein